MEMNHTDHLQDNEAIAKLRSLIKEINVCLFCTNLKEDEGASCRPMSVQKVCDQGNVFFFSEKNSEKNTEISNNKNVQLFFSHPGKGSYLIVNGTATILEDQPTIDELWNPMATAWFAQGKNDPNISVLKVKPSSAYYWDTDNNRMVNFLKLVVAAASGQRADLGSEGKLDITPTYNNPISDLERREF